MPVLVRRFGLIIIIAIVVIGVIVFRDRLSGNVTDLAVGDCFDVPTDASATVSEIQHHPCTEAHTGQVFCLAKNPADGTALYPSDAAMVASADEACAAPFLTFVGVAMDQSVYDIRYFGPTADGWAKGDRDINGYVLTDPAVTTSIKDSKK
jgi:hypothetical protein